MVKLKLTRPNRRHEAELWRSGFGLVVGVDEVGRGSLAGPVTAAGVILPKNCRLPGVRDSKLLTKLQRHRLAERIKRTALAIGVGWANSLEVDEMGLTWAVTQSGLRALSQLQRFDAVLLDGNFNYLPNHRTTTIVKGDRCCLSVAAASIVAKVARDNYMAKMHQLYPEFAFDQNVGYGTRRHLKQLSQGLTPLHRRSFAPVGSYVD